jgi:hypothetical protein
LIRVARQAGDRVADQHLVMALAVKVAGIEQRHAGVERGMNRRDGLVAVRRPVRARHAHAPKSDCRGRRSTLA